MFLKKLTLSCLIFLAGTFSHSCPMIRGIQHIQADLNDTEKIKNAAYFKIHYHDGCYTYMISDEIWCDTEDVSEFIFSKTKDCQELCNWHEHAISHNQRIVTYYDRDWAVIATMDVSYLALTNSKLLHYIKKRIDPDTKVKVATAEIKKCRCELLESHLKIIFYDSHEKIILEAQCPKKLKSQKKVDDIYCVHHQSNSGNYYDLERFEYCLDLRDLGIIQDCRSSYKTKDLIKKNKGVLCY